MCWASGRIQETGLLEPACRVACFMVLILRSANGSHAIRKRAQQSNR